jgi:hypothetical protein
MSAASRPLAGALLRNRGASGLLPIPGDATCSSFVRLILWIFLTSFG